MSTSFVCSQVLTALNCAQCGVLFAFPQAQETEFRNDHRTFYCPVGHSNYFPSETEAEKLKRQVAQLQTTVEHKDARIVELRASEKHLIKSRQGMKGALVKTQKRIRHGVCPCCTRTFSNLADHMATKHPDYSHKPDVA